MASNQNASKSAKMTEQTTAELEWIRFREETLGPAAYGEAAGSKLVRKMKENPFVPLGAFSTLGALSYGLWCFRQGRARDSQMMMRARIAAQGFTIVAIMAGVVLGSSPRTTDSSVVVKTEPPPKNSAGS
ncbi:HIG1 domain family member 2A [Orchesella cincta]|uniref:HIG1 domain family member 2A n=1 Tax=Orchesella cincta TaxID=48709 RepID=A0A1D2MQ39_ORCCI|nr:HIG1 domain family member 2A [Orchesella cincta]